MNLILNARGQRLFVILFVGLLSLQMSLARAEPVAVRQMEGSVHGFLVLRTLQGEELANGDLLQSADGDRVTCRLVFHFKDGSLHDETVIFSQRSRFRLLNYHLVQKGPAFPVPMDVLMDGDSGRMSVRYKDRGTEKIATGRFGSVPDLANGLIPVLLKNFPRGAKSMTVSMAAETPKPRLVKLDIVPEGVDTISLGNSTRPVIRYRAKVNIGGLAGVFVPLVGKQPPDIHVWILGGEAPAFVRSEGPLFLGGPVWRIDLASPEWK